ncbi:MAG: starch-binding outer membrane lipoprotein SusD [Prevotella sp.]|nr:starch-binding outer membrane lipoprotein SusD [Prevotella sp.]
MKNIILKTAVVGLLALGFTSCADDLNIHSIDPKSSPSYDVKQLLAKQYATLGVTGQTGPAGKGDLSMDEGESGFFRTVFNLEELPTDECAWAWTDNIDIPNILGLSWTSSSQRAAWCWSRLAYDVRLYNQFIAECGEQVGPQVTAEVRFLRALHYYYFLDLFHKAPFKLTNDMNLPGQKTGIELYKWIDQELTNLEDTLADMGTYDNASGFGRADKGAAYALHAQLCLNAAVYTDGQITTEAWKKAKHYCDLLIDGPYKLSDKAVKDPSGNEWSGYEQLFMGDNDENTNAMKEIIFPIRQDGASTQEYAGSTCLIGGSSGAGMPYKNTNNYWTCYFARVNVLQKFFADPEKDMPRLTEDESKEYKDAHSTEAEVISIDNKLGISTKDVQKKAGDKRALFYMGIGGADGGKYRTLTPGKQISGFLNGASIVKWTNYRSNGGARHNDTFDDTDIPLFRLGTIYMTRAEVEYRLGDADAAAKDINTLRTRAGNTNLLSAASIDDQTLIDEWSRETYFEGRRRSDLVRFGLFTGSKYLWSFKGGVPDGTGVDSRYNIYPVPAIDVSGNPAITQNPGY